MITQYGTPSIKIRKEGTQTVYRIVYVTDSTEYLCLLTPVKMAGRVTRVDHYHSDSSYTGKVAISVLDTDGIDHLMAEASFPANADGTIDIRSGTELPVVLMGDFIVKIISASASTFGVFEIFVQEL